MRPRKTDRRGPRREEMTNGSITAAFAAALFVLVAAAPGAQSWKGKGGGTTQDGNYVVQTTNAGSVMLDRDCVAAGGCSAAEYPAAGTFEFALACEDSRSDLNNGQGLGVGIYHFRDDGRYTLSWSNLGDGLSETAEQGFWWKVPNASTWTIAVSKSNAVHYLQFLTERVATGRFPAWRYHLEKKDDAYASWAAAWESLRDNSALAERFGSAAENHVVNPHVITPGDILQLANRDVGTVVARTVQWGGREWRMFCARVNADSIPAFDFGIVPD